MTYVMGDPHGEWIRFTDMVEQIHLQPGDCLFVPGDAVDRGTEGIKILQYIKSHSNSMTLLLGNHEYMMLQVLSGDLSARRSWMLNGGEATFEAYMKLPEEERAQILRWLGNLPTSARVTVSGKTFHLTHGWPGESLYDTVWGRPFSLSQENPIPNCTLIVGHTPVCLIAKGSMPTDRYLRYLEEQGDHMRILHAPHFIDIDCGCGHDVYGARRACLRLEDMAEFYVY